MYDAEEFLDDVLSIVKDNLNTELTKISAQKAAKFGADPLTIKEIPDAAYFDTLSNECAEFDPYVYYGIADVGIIENHGEGAENLDAFVFVVLLNEGSKQSPSKQMLRYIRALRSVMNDNKGKIKFVSQLKVGAITPVDMRDLEIDTHPHYKVGGIRVTAALA